jgi:hypothetical protein
MVMVGRRGGGIRKRLPTIGPTRRALDETMPGTYRYLLCRHEIRNTWYFLSLSFTSPTLLSRREPIELDATIAA